MSSLDITKHLQVPTLERPFGIALWPIFDRIFYSVKGYHADEFEFNPAGTPMASTKSAFTAIVTYYVVILGGRELMRSRPAVKLNTIFKFHNFFLSSFSGALLLMFLEQIVPTIYHHGLFFSICDPAGGWTPQLVILYYLNYLTKYFELLDTVFLVLKKKPLTFLHCYHHGATALLCFSQLLGVTTVSWVPISLNLTVHVIMYWYYYQSARGIRVWWKEWITRLQIIQFVIDLGFIYFAAFNYFISAHRPSFPHYGKCAGEDVAALSGIGILTSYLVLFISFYIVTYSKSSGKRASGRKAAKSLKDAEIPDVQAILHGNSTKSPSGTNATRSNRSRKA
ncbi:Elongation of fatty acids protein 2 [Golovinomyces cichoracearum]|uniref:Elongation of fatty acids protein n=1 Tax=Golovinomyces cichoracearum TaxID=62708 RepID=A0A420HW04_9PEZI|nr:Elongation of fatty acids protein 2 [Golovinomyces cichoracearum]